ncbi:hypothetical protein LshimejAT787_0904680 [Lyophyllum shimeji]|uniref:Uncharacterized protein n=1 Tax=Lyophyllum shimeji TaxID=47721 RepID=A0A9P3PTE8_LYOSH|nr:hypothetical protein LshimejAT787_0904680 [Lyophyllum shimeji]
MGCTNVTLSYAIVRWSPGPARHGSLVGRSNATSPTLTFDSAMSQRAIQTDFLGPRRKPGCPSRITATRYLHISNNRA